MVGQAVYSGNKFLQKFPAVLDPSPQLSMECFHQVVIIVVIPMHHRNLFVCRPIGDTMQNACGGLIQEDYQMCGLVAACPAVMLHYGLELLWEHSP
jgi:hypothetical protein